MGLSCDHCAPDHWNLAAGAGCEACGCDPNNSVTSSCNEVLGHTLQERITESGTISDFFLLLCAILSSLASASVVTALEERLAQIVRRTTGETPGRSAEVIQTCCPLQAVTSQEPNDPQTKMTKFCLLLMQLPLRQALVSGWRSFLFVHFKSRYARTVVDDHSSVTVLFSHQIPSMFFFNFCSL